MATPISRRTILAAGAGAAAGLSVPGVAAYAGGRSTTSVGFRLNAEVLDGGEQVTSITLDTARLGPIDPASLTTGTFSVHAKATSPIPIAPGDLIFSEYDLDRPVTAVRLDHRGNIVLDLSLRRGPGRRRHPRLHREQGPQRAARPRLHHHSERPDRLAQSAARSPSRASCRAGCPTPRWTRSATTSPARV